MVTSNPALVAATAEAQGTRRQPVAVVNVSPPRCEAVSPEAEEGQDDLGGPGRIRGICSNRHRRVSSAEGIVTDGPARHVQRHLPDTRLGTDAVIYLDWSSRPLPAFRP